MKRANHLEREWQRFARRALWSEEQLPLHGALKSAFATGMMMALIIVNVLDDPEYAEVRAIILEGLCDDIWTFLGKENA